MVLVIGVVDKVSKDESKVDEGEGVVGESEVLKSSGEPMVTFIIGGVEF